MERIRGGVAATLVALVAAVVCSVSSASGTANDPLRLVLQRSDLPAKATWSSARDAAAEKTLSGAGFQAKAAFFSAEIARGSTETLLVSGRVIALGSPAQARRVFVPFKRDLALDLKRAKIVRLPAYGDEQSAFTQTDPGVRADLRARTGAVIWRLEIKWAGVEKFTRAQALAELQTYAAKLKRRVGRG